jgi:glycosyltransferase involved in cell wall biosynthesis
MRVLCLYPGLNPEVNDVAQVLAYLSSVGEDVAVITATRNPSKAVASSESFEEFAGVRIYRPYKSFSEMMWIPQKRLGACRAILHDSRPDVILCSQEYNMRLALLLREQQDVPIVLVTEYGGDLADGVKRGRRARTFLPLLGVPARGKRFWAWLCQNSAAVITAYPGDGAREEELSGYGSPVYHVPWCNELPVYRPVERREPSRAAYVGTFSRKKNTQEFGVTIPLILEHTPVEEFIAVGSGDIGVVNKLVKQYGPRMRHVAGLSRRAALELLSGCYFAYTPVKRGGWGFIGDCWGTRTPLVVTHNDYQLNDGMDAVVVSSSHDIPQAVMRLYKDEDLYKTLQEQGFCRHKAHTARAVGDQYRQVLREAVDGRRVEGR